MKTVSLTNEFGASQQLSASAALQRLRKTLQTQGPGPAARGLAELAPQFLEQNAEQAANYHLLQAEYFSAIRDPASALAAIEQALQRQKTARAYDEQSKQLLKLGQPKEAIAAIKRAMQLEPKNAELVISAARLCKSLGMRDKASAFIDRAIALEPNNFKGYMEKTYLPDSRLNQAEVAACQKIIEQSNSAIARYNTFFSLARHYEQQGDYSEQLAMLKAGNAEKIKSLGGIKPPANHQDAARIQATFAEPALRQRLALQCSSAADSSETPLVFILGFPRSGSTLTEQILASHSEVDNVGESMALPRALYHFDKLNYPEWLNTASDTLLQDIRDYILQQIRPATHQASSGKRITVEKSLDNIYYLGLLKLLFPTAKFVHTYKQPIENCFGCYKQVFSGDAWSCIYDLDTLRDAYSNYHQLMQYWQSQFAGDILHFSYEALLDDQAKSTAELLDFCGLAWQDNCLDFHQQQGKQVATASVWQVRQALNKNSLNRWQRYGEALHSLLPLQELSSWTNN